VSIYILVVGEIDPDWYRDTVTDTASLASGEWAAALGRTIKVWRTDIGMSRRQLAQKASISYSYLSAIENGSKVPSTKILRVLADRLGVRAQDLHAAAEERLSMHDTSHESHTDRDNALIEAQERRFVQRQQARFGYASTGSLPPAGAEELVELLPHLDREDIVVLVAVARRLAEAKTDDAQSTNR
jgi:transcriptional regulator with XRE-family HTH domain